MKYEGVELVYEINDKRRWAKLFELYIEVYLWG